MKRLITMGLIAALLAIGSPAQISSAQDIVPPSIVYTVVPLIAGRDNQVGVVRVWNSVTVFYVQTILNDGWLLNDIQVCITTDPSLIPQTKTGNPIPGHFLIKEVFLPAAPNFTFGVPVQWPVGTQLYIAVHATLSHFNDDYSTLLGTDSAWAAGVPFEGSNWATYFVDLVDKAIIPK